MATISWRTAGLFFLPSRANGGGEFRVWQHMVDKDDHVFEFNTREEAEEAFARQLSRDRGALDKIPAAHCKRQHLAHARPAAAGRHAL